MRKIELEMNYAIAHGKNWSKDNTMVRTNSQTGLVDVYLHGHHIASVDVHTRSWSSWYGKLTVNRETLSRWPTNTTKSRLRALGADVYTKSFTTYLDGEPV